MRFLTARFGYDWQVAELRALTVAPRIKGSIRLEEVPEPQESDGAVLVRTAALGICATDREIVAGEYGAAPTDQSRLILGHESLGVVESTPRAGDLKRGDVIVGIVRRPDPVPCPACSAGEWDMCGNGLYTERGIKERQGFGAERFRIEPDFAVKIDPVLGLCGVLLEPASIVAKAWDHVERIGRRAHWSPRTLLVTGAGPIGLLAALMGALRGLKVHVFDRHQGGARPKLVSDIGGSYHCKSAEIETLSPDIIMECTGAPALILSLLGHAAPDGIICLTGVSSPSPALNLDMGMLNRRLVLNNNVVFGSVNANRRHYETASRVLGQADGEWLGRLITRRLPVERWSEALEHRADDIKVVIEFAPLRASQGPPPDRTS